MDIDDTCWLSFKSIGRFVHTAPNSMKLHEFFGVSERTTRRWQAAGADLSDTRELMHFLRNMERPAASVEERLADPDCHDDLVALLGGAHVGLSLIHI